MGRKTEKIFNELFKYLEQNGGEDLSDKEMELLVQKFMREHNGNIPDEVTEETARTADDYLELAEYADDEVSAVRYARKALKLDPDNLDAEVTVANLTSKNPVNYLKKLERIIIHGDKLLQKRGYTGEDSIGCYWKILETRPYMRVRMEYMMTLKECGMFRKAAAECEEIIRLNENDNMGIRFTLIHLYAFLEEEQKALELLKKYNEYDETQMMLGLSVLYFKLNNLEKSASYLRRLAKINEDTQKFFTAVLEGDTERYFDDMSDYGYRPSTIEDLLMGLSENQELFETTLPYFPWAYDQLKTKKK